MPSKHYLTSQVLARVNADRREVAAAIEQVLNTMLRPQHLETLAFGETSLPEGHVLVTYEEVPVVAWNGVSKLTLPAIPTRLPMGMGLWEIRPNATDNALTVAAPTGTVAFPNPSNPDGSVTAQWTSLTGITYYVQWDVDPDFTSGIPEDIGNDSSITFDATANTFYYFRVKATKGGYNDSEWVTVTTKTFS